MKADGVKVTWVAPEETVDVRDLPGFIDVCQYGRGMEVERNELGCIGDTRFAPTPTKVAGVWSTPIKVRERIFIVQPEEPRWP